VQKANCLSTSVPVVTRSYVKNRLCLCSPSHSRGRHHGQAVLLQGWRRARPQHDVPEPCYSCSDCCVLQHLAQQYHTDLSQEISKGLGCAYWQRYNLRFRAIRTTCRTFKEPEDRDTGMPQVIARARATVTIIARVAGLAVITDFSWIVLRRSLRSTLRRFKVQAQFKSTNSKLHPGRSGVASIPENFKLKTNAKPCQRGKVCCARLPGSCCVRYQRRPMLAEGLMATMLSGDNLTLTAPSFTAVPWFCIRYHVCLKI
jgi:hypothetical protein